MPLWNKKLSFLQSSPVIIFPFSYFSGYPFDTVITVEENRSLTFKLEVCNLELFNCKNISKRSLSILGKIASVSGESPIIIGFITAISSSFAYLTVVGTPACTIVYAAGYLRTTDFLAVGWKMALISTIVMLLVAKLYWPLLGV